MKKIIFKNQYLNLIIGVLLGIFLSWILFNDSHRGKNSDHTKNEDKISVWTCSMHPQIRMNHPDKCPLCGMDLIPLNQFNQSNEINSDAIMLSDEAIQLANIQTSVVVRKKPEVSISLYGKVVADERTLQSQVSHVSGRIEKLYVSFTGQFIHEGQKLATIYAPELVTAQKELLEAYKIKNTLPHLYQAAREKLKLFKITDAQIETLLNTGQLQYYIDVVSNTTGVVINKMVSEGDYVGTGSILFQVADLSKVWVVFDAYESDLAHVRVGSAVQFKVPSIPGKEFEGKVTYIDPVIDPITRVSRVRVELANPNYELKPEMYAMGIVKSVFSNQNQLVIPRSAILWTGTRSIVWVKLPDISEPTFLMREIILGSAVGDEYIVLEGLSEGEEIVTEGTFSVDAAAQLEGKPSMMNPKPAISNHEYHDMHH